MGNEISRELELETICDRTGMKRDMNTKGSWEKCCMSLGGGI